MEKYVKMGYLLEGLAKHRTDVKKTDEKSDDNEVVLLSAPEIWTLDDGMEIEVCFWEWVPGMDYILEMCDISVEKEKFDHSGHADFNSYLESMGLPQKNVEDTAGKWDYSSSVLDERGYMVQYHRTVTDKS